MSGFVAVAKLDELREKRGRAVEVKNRLIALFLIDGMVHAIDDSCPHMGAPLSDGAIYGQCVMCPWHGWRFDVQTGEWLDTKRPNAIRTYETKVDEGVVWLNVNW